MKEFPEDWTLIASYPIEDRTEELAGKTFIEAADGKDFSEASSRSFAIGDVYAEEEQAERGNWSDSPLVK